MENETEDEMETGGLWGYIVFGPSGVLRSR